MEFRKVVALGLLMSLVGIGHAEDTSAVVEMDKKIVELHITFAPPPTAEVKKQRKTMLTKAGKALCSGSFISPYGHIITAKHCVDGATDISVIASDGQEYTASIRAISKHYDIAVIQVARFGGPFFELAKESLGRSETVWIMGSPLGLTGTVTRGIVSKLGGDVTFMNCTALPGNSGGPVINSKGELAGVLSAIIVVYLGPSNISIAVSTDAIRLFFYELSGGR